MAKKDFYIGIILIVVLIMVSLMRFGNELADNENILMDNSSYDYIEDMGNAIDDAGITAIAEESRGDTEREELTGTDNETSTSNVQDVLARLNFFRNMISKIEGYMRFSYNLPTLFIRSVGLPVGEMNHILNVLAIAIYLGIIFFLIKKLSGG